MKSDNLTAQLQSLFTSLIRYRIVLFIAGLALIYGFVIYRINALTVIKPSSSDIAAVQPNAPKIDTATVDKINQLQSNSVNVQALFQATRPSPFVESPKN